MPRPAAEPPCSAEIACSLAAIYGIPILYAAGNWPNCAHRYLDDEAVDALAPPDLDRNAFFKNLMRQVDWIAAHEGRAEGFLNWQGVLNNAYRLRGAQLFCDMLEAPDRETSACPSPCRRCTSR